MKGGSNIKKISLIFEEAYPLYIKIYNPDNKLIYDNIVNNGKLLLYLNECLAYRIIVISPVVILKTSFYVNHCNKYYFKMNNNSLERTITFLLTDANYNNLPIERGVMYLWQR